MPASRLSPLPDAPDAGRPLLVDLLLERVDVRMVLLLLLLGQIGRRRHGRGPRSQEVVVDGGDGVATGQGDLGGGGG